MRVRFVAEAALLNPDTQRWRKFHPGKVYDLPDERAESFIYRNAAVALTEPEQSEDPEATDDEDPAEAEPDQAAIDASEPEGDDEAGRPDPED